MAKLTKAQRQELEQVQRHLQRAFTFLQHPRIALTNKGGHATTTLHMTRQFDGAVFYEIDKHIGSDMTGLEEGLRRVNQFLNLHT